MLQSTLNRRVEDSLLALDEITPLIKLLEAFEHKYQRIEDRLRGIAEGGNRIPEHANAVHSELASLSTITKTFSARQLFRVIELLEQELSVALVDGIDDPKQITELLVELDEFAEAYNTYVVHQTGVNAVPLLRVARSLRQTLSLLRGFLGYLHSNLSGSVSPEEGEAEFSLVLSSILNLQDFADKLTALHALYAELCYVLGVSTASHPLRIAKVESGSLWTRLFGDTRAVGLMIWLIEGSVRFLHRNYTSEGKNAAIPRKLESLDKILDFSNRLKESGVDVTALQDSLAKSAVSITSSLNALTSGQPVVEVNGQVISVGHELNRALLDQISTQKITYEPPANSVPILDAPKDT